MFKMNVSKIGVTWEAAKLKEIFKEDIPTKPSDPQLVIKMVKG